MKLTCLSKGGGHHFPPCHLLELCGFRLLIDCPIDLSALSVFSPLFPNPNPNPSTPIQEGGGGGCDDHPLIRSVPRYKTPKNLHLWDPSLIDAVLVSAPAGMLGLPFLTRTGRFSGKVYATEAAAKIGRMMMEDLVSMHSEFVQFYGPGDDSDEWMKWEELERLPPALREVVVGESGEELGSWMPLYSAADVKECMQLVQPLKYAEEACFNGTILLKAFSSGLEIGSCNWTINGPRRSIAYLSSSIFQSAHSMDFDYRALHGNDLVLFSDLSSLNIAYSGDHTNVSNSHEKTKEKDLLPCDVSQIRPSYDNEDKMRNTLFNSDDTTEEINKINFICSCVVDSLRGGGSVLIPIGRLGIVLVLLEQISQALEASNLKVPIFMISSTAEEMLAFTNAVPEWLCKQRQEKLFAGEALFGHVELMRERKLNLFPLLYTPDLLLMWKEPCIVFSAHWSLRLGPVVHLLRRWHADCRCLLILEQEVDAEVALLPFKTLEIKVLQCSFLSGIKVDEIQPLLEVLQPKLILFPEDLRSLCPTITKNKNENNGNLSFLYYSQNVTVCVPKFRDNFEACLAATLAFQLRPRKLALKHKDAALARLNGGRLLLSNGKYLLVPSEAKPVVDLSNKPTRLYWGRVDPARLLSALQKKGINGSLVLPTDDATVSSDTDEVIFSIHLGAQDDVVIKTSATQTVICCADESVAAMICEALSTVCDGI